MITTPTTQLLGAADSPGDYANLTSGWALGSAFTGGMLDAPSAALMRGAEQYQQRFGQSTRAGTYMFRPGAETPVLDPAEANDRYGITGALSWDKPVRQGEAELLRQWKLEELERADRLARATPGFIPGSARFLAGMAGSNADPLGFASNFVPVLQEARWAQLGASVGVRGSRLIRGGVEGLAGGLLTEPLAYGQAQNQQGDYGAGDLALNLAFGLVGGAGIHALGGEAGDLLRRWRSTPIELRDAAINQATAAIVTGTPVRADQIMNAVTAPETLKAAALKVGDQVFSGATHGDAFEAAIGAGISEDALGLASRDSGFVTSTGRYVGREDALSIAQASGQKHRRVGNAVTSQGTTAPTIEEIRAGRSSGQVGNLKPQDVIAFVQSKGGIRDTEGHDLRNAVGQRMNPRFGALIREKGQTVDDVGESLWEAGYFGDPKTTTRPTEAEVVDLLRKASGQKVYSELANVSQDVDQYHGRDLAGEELGRVAEENGVNVSDVERSAALDLMMSRGLSASDALDHVLERTSMEGGTFSSTSQRLADVEARLERAQNAGAPLRDLAPLLDERASLQADLAAERLPAIGETIKGDLRGDTPGSLDYAGMEASRAADQDAKEALPVTEAVAQAKAARMSAEAYYRAVGGELLPAEIQAMDAELAHTAAKREAAMSLAGCMIREGV